MLISTSRLILRPLTAEDAQGLFNYKADRIANQYQGWIPVTLEDAQAFIRDKVSPVPNVQGTWHQLAIVRKADRVLIGDVGIHFLGDQQTEIGYTVDKRHQGVGYATEALQAVIEYLFTTLDKCRITATIDPRNDRSIKLIERLGFRKMSNGGEVDAFPEHAMNDDVVYVITRNDRRR